jgi:hypothetical protein
MMDLRLDTLRDTGKETRVETHGKEVHVPQNSKPVKYSVSECRQCFESGTCIFFGFVPW